MIFVVFGSRSWDDADRIEQDITKAILDGDGSLTIVTGANGCPDDGDAWTEVPTTSADAIADFIGHERGFAPVREYADWMVHDWDGLTPVQCYHAPSKDRCPAAGPRRNQAIIDHWILDAIEVHEPFRVRGYRMPGESPGTDDMAERMRVVRARCEELRIPFDGKLVKRDPSRPSSVPRRTPVQIKRTFEPWPDL